jgi:hypothetical protein
MDKELRQKRRNLTAKHARKVNKAIKFADRRSKIKAGYIKHKGELL